MRVFRKWFAMSKPFSLLCACCQKFLTRDRVPAALILG